MESELELEGHTPFFIFHSSMLIPIAALAIGVDGLLGELIVTKPDVSTHVPVPGAGVLPAIKAAGELMHRV